MALFRKGPSPHQTALAMIGARAGTRVLVAGSPLPGVVAEVAGVTGLNGQTLRVVPPDAREPYERAAAEAGVLVEMTDAPAGDAAALPPDARDYDVVVLHHDLVALDDAARQRLVAAAFDAARPGGRVVIIEGRPATRWFGRREPTLPGPAILSLLQTAGGLAVRELGSADGVSYYEARKAR